ncbi:helix-turn-helix transcriptional regulator [Aerophototrophica crusticola]|uniref:Helix-turn-helix transcriptional regulator n=1 Tax=Aerophototrophica crusticola TaxID=1709002 RepID=A0A858R8M7_9PROT|nr:helix-turn-helix transcriptional regulator [Rhodospirillaceae bacterium B3]
MDAAEFGRLVRQHRVANRLTQEEVALLIGSGPRFIVDLEAGKPTAHLGKALAAAEAVGLRLLPEATGPAPVPPDDPGGYDLPSTGNG